MNQNLIVNGISILILRVCLSGIFITAGITHFIAPEEVAKRMQAAAFSEFAGMFGDPYLLAVLSGIGLLLGGLALLFGVYNRWAAAMLFLILIPITITVQFGNGIVYGPLWKNIALFGSLLFFIINNPSAYSLYTRQ